MPNARTAFQIEEFNKVLNDLYDTDYDRKKVYDLDDVSISDVANGVYDVDALESKSTWLELRKKKWKSMIQLSDEDKSMIREGKEPDIEIRLKRLGFKFRLLKSENLRNHICVTQVVAFSVKEEYNYSIFEINRDEVKIIKEYFFDGTEFFSNIIEDQQYNENFLRIKWYQFENITYSELAENQFIDDNPDNYLEHLNNVVKKEYPDQEDIGEGHISDEAGEVYRKISLASDSADNKSSLEFYQNRGGLFDFAFFSDADISLLHGTISKNNNLYFKPLEVRTEVRPYAELLFSGARINTGRFGRAMSQIEMVASTRDKRYPIHSEYDFTLKAEVIVKGVKPVGVISPIDEGRKQPVSTQPLGRAQNKLEKSSRISRMVPQRQKLRFSRGLLGPDVNDENIDSEVHSLDSVNDTELPMVAVGLPCPRVWET